MKYLLAFLVAASVSFGQNITNPTTLKNDNIYTSNLVFKTNGKITFGGETRSNWPSSGGSGTFDIQQVLTNTQPYTALQTFGAGVVVSNGLTLPNPWDAVTLTTSFDAPWLANPSLFYIVTNQHKFATDKNGSLVSLPTWSARNTSVWFKANNDTTFILLPDNYYDLLLPPGSAPPLLRKLEGDFTTIANFAVGQQALDQAYLLSSGNWAQVSAYLTNYPEYLDPAIATNRTLLIRQNGQLCESDTNFAVANGILTNGYPVTISGGTVNGGSSAVVSNGGGLNIEVTGGGGVSSGAVNQIVSSTNNTTLALVAALPTSNAVNSIVGATNAATLLLLNALPTSNSVNNIVGSTNATTLLRVSALEARTNLWNGAITNFTINGLAITNGTVLNGILTNGLTGSLFINGATTISNTLTVTGNATLSGNINATGATWATTSQLASNLVALPNLTMTMGSSMSIVQNVASQMQFSVVASGDATFTNGNALGSYTVASNSSFTVGLTVYFPALASGKIGEAYIFTNGVLGPLVFWTVTTTSSGGIGVGEIDINTTNGITNLTIKVDHADTTTRVLTNFLTRMTLRKNP